MKNGVDYKGMHLSKNSDAYKLYESGEMAKLDAHLKEVEVRQREQMAKVDREDAKLAALKAAK